ncbi:MAG TPA: hypothetical protein PLB30_07580 [Thermoleophilia bacterium]|nr:hypothetical protein [Thermoleophilia bacterium]
MARVGPTRELVAAIRTRIEDSNEDPRPFVWHRTAAPILDSVAQHRQLISD